MGGKPLEKASWGDASLVLKGDLGRGHRRDRDIEQDTALGMGMAGGCHQEIKQVYDARM